MFSETLFHQLGYYQKFKNDLIKLGKEYNQDGITFAEKADIIMLCLSIVKVLVNLKS